METTNDPCTPSLLETANQDPHGDEIDVMQEKRHSGYVAETHQHWYLERPSSPNMGDKTSMTVPYAPTIREEAHMVSLVDLRSVGTSSQVEISPVTSLEECVVMPHRDRRESCSATLQPSGNRESKDGDITIQDKIVWEYGRDEMGVDGEEQLNCKTGDSFRSGDSPIGQSEKDQRMWSALKTSLLSADPTHRDHSLAGAKAQPAGYQALPQWNPSVEVDNTNERATNDVMEITYWNDRPGTEGARDMEQLHQERSAMDRMMRPRRTVSARLLGTSQENASSNKARGNECTHGDCGHSRISRHYAERGAQQLFT